MRGDEKPETLALIVEYPTLFSKTMRIKKTVKTEEISSAEKKDKLFSQYLMNLIQLVYITPV